MTKCHYLSEQIPPLPPYSVLTDPVSGPSEPIFLKSFGAAVGVMRSQKAMIYSLLYLEATRRKENLCCFFYSFVVVWLFPNGIFSSHHGIYWELLV